MEKNEPKTDVEKIVNLALMNGWMQCQLQAYSRLKSSGESRAAEIVVSLVRED